MSSSKFSVSDCSIIHFPRICNRAGNITALQNNMDVPFAIKRVYYLYDVPTGQTRGAHAHKNLQQLIVATSGSFEVTLDDGENRQAFQLNRPDYGLHIYPFIWCQLSNFSSGAICLVLASEPYNPDDYIREYEKFKTMKSK